MLLETLCLGVGKQRRRVGWEAFPPACFALAERVWGVG